jgi:UDP-GlcNAc3NAcA epimerase
LRSFNMRMPEEVNRILTDRISDILFAPTQTAIDNLKLEGFDNLENKVFRSGDVMLDAGMFYAQRSKERATLPSEFFEGDFILCTLHRAENTDDKERLTSIVNALNTIHESTRVVMPLHPRTSGLIEKYGLELKVDLIDPVGYFDMIELLKNCSLVMTDSGGLQKEAYFFEKNCVTMRDETEWVELVENGFNLLSGANGALIIEHTQTMLSKASDFSSQLYGDGHAGEQIVEILLNS